VEGGVGMGRGLSSGTDKTIKKKGIRQVGESKQAMVLVSITPWRPCPQAIYFHRVITTSSPPYFLGPTIIALFTFLRVHGLGLGSSPIGHVHALSSFLLPPSRTIFHAFA
jgi:hypothetical protein